MSRTSRAAKIRMPYVDPAVIRSKARILLIDDDKFAYETLFKIRDGYRLERWSQVKSMTELQDGTFDLIILDYHGIAPKSAPTGEGLAILRAIKEASPEQLVLAYSGQQIGLQSSEFISLADDVVSKSEDYPVFKGKVDALLSKRYSVGYYVSRMNVVLGEDVLKVPGFVRKATRSITRNDADALRRYLEKADVSQLHVDRIINLASIAITVVSML